MKKPITEEEREEGGREGCVQRIRSFASLTLSPQYKGPNIFSGFSVAQS